MDDYKEYVTSLPLHMRDAVLLYIEHGYMPGSFLTALLSNDLKETFARADDVNQRAVRDYVQYLYSFAPGGCWGSPERVQAWVAKGGLLGRAEAA